jgi:phosphate transport system substrate-binding protein
MLSNKNKATLVLGISVALAASAIFASCLGCNPPPPGGGTTTGTTGTTGTAGSPLEGNITMDGSSTVMPISEAVSEEFQKANPKTNPTVAESGTGGGFKKFCMGEIDIANASRPIKDEELKACEDKGINFIEIPVGYDGLSVVVNPKNTWAESLTVAELKKIWNKDSKITNWKDVRAGFPDKPMKLYGPGTDSGTFDYFTEVINGKKGDSRKDYTPSEDDNTLVQGVAGDEGGMAYFGFSYYVKNTDKLKIVKIDGGKGPIEPTHETIKSLEYAPLSRPLFIYVSTTAAEKPQVKAFVEMMMSAQGSTLVEEVGYVALPEAELAAGLKRFQDNTTGTMYTAENKGKSLAELLGAK